MAYPPVVWMVHLFSQSLLWNTTADLIRARAFVSQLWSKVTNTIICTNSIWPHARTIASNCKDDAILEFPTR